MLKTILLVDILKIKRVDNIYNFHHKGKLMVSSSKTIHMNCNNNLTNQYIF